MTEVSHEVPGTIPGGGSGLHHQTTAARREALDFLRHTMNWNDEFNSTISLSRKHARRMRLRIKAARAILASSPVGPVVQAEDEAPRNRASGGPSPQVRIIDRSGLMQQTQDLIRSMVPFNSTVVLLGNDTEWLCLEGRRAWRLPLPRLHEQGNGHPLVLDGFIADLEEKIAEGAEYLIVPFTTLDWPEAHKEVVRALQARFRRVSNQEICQVYALGTELQDLSNRSMPDGLPVPPPELISLSAGGATIESFFRIGAQDAAVIRSILERHERDIHQFESILDFGCGCGRVIRHWQELTRPRLVGCDYNPFQVAWCRKNLPWASFLDNGVAAMLPFETSSLDFIYAISVFTHLDRDKQFFWFNELHRVLKSGGLLFFSTSGVSKASKLPASAQQLFASDDLVVLTSEFAGSNACAAYHPERFVRETLSGPLEVVDFVPDGMARGRQDAWLLRKPA